MALRCRHCGRDALPVQVGTEPNGSGVPKPVNHVRIERVDSHPDGNFAFCRGVACRQGHVGNFPIVADAEDTKYIWETDELWDL